MFKNVFSFETFIIHVLAWTYKPWINWQLPDIDKTITNNILSSSLSGYAVRMGRYSHSVNRQ